MKHVGTLVLENANGDFHLINDDEHAGRGNFQSSERPGEVDMVLYMAGDEPHHPETFLKIEGIPVNLTGFPKR